MKQIDSYQEKLKLLGSRHFTLEEQQKKKIAEDLHDHVGQALAILKFKLGKLKGDAVFCGFDDDIDEMRKLIDQIIKYTRDLTVELSPRILYDLGFAKALDWLSTQMKTKHDLQVWFEDKTNNFSLPENERVALFRSVQELLINVLKHATKKEAWLTLSIEDGYFVTTIKDEGPGFDDNQNTQNSYGLFSIRERLEALGGSLEIQSQIHQNTEIKLRVKIHET